MKRQKILAGALALTVALTPAVRAFASGTDWQYTGFENETATLTVTQIGRYDSGAMNPDGGSAEIVAYNSANGYAYVVNGTKGTLDVLDLKGVGGEGIQNITGQAVDVSALVTAGDFTYGDMTSVAISPDGSLAAVAIQAEAYDQNGVVALFHCGQGGGLTVKSVVSVGVQPDMVTFTPDGSKILTANEGEPRLGYTEADPMGTVTVISAGDGTAQTLDFTEFDSKREELVASGIILKKNTAPSVDLEPEYIAATDETAYISLQEANAIAVLDLNTLRFTGIHSVGFQDHGLVPIDLDKGDEIYAPATYPGVKGIRMPDGIAVTVIGGVTYLLTANEGDSREWGDYCNEVEVKKNKPSPKGNIPADTIGGKVVYFDDSDYDGLEAGTDYLFGGRSFTVFQVTDSGLTQVFDSGDAFEKRTAQLLPENFNCSNDDRTPDDRSGKKGPEPETVAVGSIGSRTYAFVCLERIGGVMIYDITNPSQTSYVNYINSRDFSEDIRDDVSPEGLCFIPGENGRALLLAACEVSGTVAMYELEDTTLPEPVPDPAPEPEPDSDSEPAPDGEEIPKTGDAFTAESALLLLLPLCVLTGLLSRRKYAIH